MSCSHISHGFREPERSVNGYSKSEAVAVGHFKEDDGMKSSKVLSVVSSCKDMARVGSVTTDRFRL